MDLQHACDEKWEILVAQFNITFKALTKFLEYAAMFLCNLGHLYISWVSYCQSNAERDQGEGDQKFVPDITAETLRKIADISPKTKAGLDKIIDPLLAVPLFSLGYPSKNAQSGYYPGIKPITQDKIAKVSEVISKTSIRLENTRVRKVVKDGKPVLQLLQASVETGLLKAGHNKVADGMFLVRRDHSDELEKVCSALGKAKYYAGNDMQI